MSTSPPRVAPSFEFARLSPALKVVLCVGVIAVVGGLVQTVAWLVGSEFRVLAPGGNVRTMLVLLGFGGFWFVLSRERRPLADYGMVFGNCWSRELFGGLAAGLAVWLGIQLLALSNGILTIHGGETAYRWFSACLTGLTALVSAFFIESIFRGYLLRIFRDRYGMIAAVVVVSILFAFAGAAFHGFASGAIVSLFLAGVLFSVLRLRTGAVLVSTGLLGGWLGAGVVTRRTQLLVPCGDGVSSVWLVPSGDPIQAPLLWIALLVAIIMGVLRLWRRGETSAMDEPTLAVTFKKVWPVSSFAMMAPLDLWLGRLWHARFAVGGVYLLRLIVILLCSAVNTVLSLPERLLLPCLLRRRRVPDPVFILGMHRSGTTHLHNLMALDPQFVTPRTYQVMNPVGFLFSGWLFTPILGLFYPWKRPMDAVKLDIFSPQEEEFALMNLTRVSPYWGMTFPRHGAAYDRYIFPERFTARERTSWAGQFTLFLRKLVFWSGKRPLLKNPYNTARVAALHQLFPRAKFIHIHRHPYAVYRSNVHMERESHCLFQLQDPDERSTYSSRVLDNYRAMEDAFYAQSAAVPAEQVAEVCFDDLERDPLGQIERVYQALGMTITPAFRDRLEAYLIGVADYQKNRFPKLPEELKREVHGKMAPYFDRWGYEADLPTSAAA